jgi:hypothetical protein
MLLVPSRELNEIVIGVFGRAQRLYKVRICGFVAMPRPDLPHGMRQIGEQSPRLSPLPTLYLRWIDRGIPKTV